MVDEWAWHVSRRKEVGCVLWLDEVTRITWRTLFPGNGGTIVGER